MPRYATRTAVPTPRQASPCPRLALTALQLAVASAAASGASRLEAAAVVTEASTLDGAGHSAVRDLSADAPIYVAAPDGTVLGTVVQ